jgi:predicted DNA-binding protein (UPF0251 family)
MSHLEVVGLSVDELEAVRLADLQGMYQSEAARMMGVSRQTFGRIVCGARRKIAEALVLGKALRIEGGRIHIPPACMFQCGDCREVWEESQGSGKPACCPACRGAEIGRVVSGGSD